MVNHVHVLLALAHRFPLSELASADGWVYRRDIGAWVAQDSPDDLMINAMSNPDPNSPEQPPRPPMTKKNDIETGEDLKGA